MAVRVKGFKVGGIDVKAPPERTAARWEEAIVSGGLAGAPPRAPLKCARGESNDEAQAASPLLTDGVFHR